MSDESIRLDSAARAALIAARRSKRWTQADVAQRIGVSLWTYGRFERGAGAVSQEAWERLQEALPLLPETVGRPAPIGAVIRAARRARRLTLRDVAARAPFWSDKRLRRLERGDDPWPVDACADLARVVGVDPSSLGIGSPAVLVESLTALMWSAYYDRPSDLRVVAGRIYPLSASLCAHDAGVWMLQALGVALRDARRASDGWSMLLQAAQRADPHANALQRNAYVAAHMRLARAALEMARSMPQQREAWTKAAVRHSARARQYADSVRPRLRVVVFMTEAEAAAAQGRIDDAAAAMHVARAAATTCAGRDDIVGVTVHDIGVAHAALVSMLHAPNGMTVDRRQRILALIRDVTSLVHDPQTPQRWQVDIQASIALGWATVGRDDMSLHACSQAVSFLHRCMSPAIAQRIHAALRRLPESADRTVILRELESATERTAGGARP